MTKSNLTINEVTHVTSDSPHGDYLNWVTWNPPNPLLLAEKMKVSFLTSAQAFALNFAVSFTLPFPAGSLPPGETRLFWKSVNFSEWYLKIKYNWFHSSLNLSYQELIFSLFCFTHLEVIWMMTVETPIHKYSSSFVPFYLNLSLRKLCIQVHVFVQVPFHIYSYEFTNLHALYMCFCISVSVCTMYTAKYTHSIQHYIYYVYVYFFFVCILMQVCLYTYNHAYFSLQVFYIHL